MKSTVDSPQPHVHSRTVCVIGLAGRVKDVMMKGLAVLDMARDLGLQLPASRAADEIVTKLQDRGGARRDSAAIGEVLADSR